MKKKIPMICNVIGAVLVIAFAVKCMFDYSQYTITLNSAPFSIWIAANALLLLIPAAIVFVVGRIAKKKWV